MSLQEHQLSATELSSRVVKLLRRAGYTTIESVNDLTDEQLRLIRGIGRPSVIEIREECAFARDLPPPSQIASNPFTPESIVDPSQKENAERDARKAIERARQTFRVGDAVYLKSGSQKMTVENVAGDNISVVWMAYDTHIMQRDILPSAVLSRGRAYVPG